MTKVVILAGGLGTRLSEETHNIPKPMVEIGDRPILWHIMKSYLSYEYNSFILALGYKGEKIKEYLLTIKNLYLVGRNSDFEYIHTHDIMRRSRLLVNKMVSL